MVSIDIAILGDVSRMTSPIRRAICNVGRQVMSIVRQGNQNGRKKMSSVLSNALVVLLIIPFRFTTIFGWCDHYSSSCGTYQVCCARRCALGSNCLHLVWSIKDLLYGIKNTEKIIFVPVYFRALKREPVLCKSDGAFRFSRFLLPSRQRNH